MPGENCSSSCKTKDHESFGACMRSKALRVAYCASWKGADATRQKRWDRELASYKAARAQGVQPAGTQPHQVRNAMTISEKTGQAFQA